jgi:nucleotide-binding universal stress UspA family protein
MVLTRPRRDDEAMNSTNHPDDDLGSAFPHGPLLLCYDESEDAKYAIESAGALLASRHALVVTVWQPLAGMGGIAWEAPPNLVNFAELDRAAAEDGGRVASDGVRVAHEAGLEAEPIAVKTTGSVWRTILETADCHDAAAIVMGSRGLSGIRSMLLGSVSSAVVHHADRPTLVVHRPSDETTARQIGEAREGSLAGG